jgi:hypothetical protein
MRFIHNQDPKALALKTHEAKPKLRQSERVAGLTDGHYTVAMSITAIVEKDTVKLPDGIHVPDGTRVRLEIATAGASQWPADYFERTAGALAGEPLERPAQGDAPQREGW